MNENLNLIESLKDAEGTILYSSLCGDCKFIGIDKSSPLCIVLCDCHNKYWNIYPNGRVTREGECVVFPSRENRDWATFKVSKNHKVFKPFEKVLVKEIVGKNFDKSVWLADEYSHYDEDLKQHYCTKAYGFDDDQIIPYEGNEDMVGKEVKL